MTSAHLCVCLRTAWRAHSGFGPIDAFYYGIANCEDKSELKKYVEDIAETAYIQAIYGQINGQWNPISNSGQDPEWDKHLKFRRKILQICKAKHQAYEEWANKWT